MSRTHRIVSACGVAACLQLVGLSTASADPASAPPAASYAPEEPPAIPADPMRYDPEGPATLFGSSKHVLGGFGAFEAAYTHIAGQDVSLGCGEGAVLFDHTLSIGGSLCGVLPRMDGTQYGNVVHSPGDRMEVAYGGLAVRYHFFAKELFQFSVGATVGGGAVVITNPNESWGTYHNEHTKNTDGFFAFEPRLTGYVNLTRWARFGAFAGYRFVSGINTTNLSAGDIAGPTLGGTMQFGWF